MINIRTQHRWRNRRPDNRVEGAQLPIVRWSNITVTQRERFRQKQFVGVRPVWPGILIFQIQIEPLRYPLNDRTGNEPHDKN